jgi:hypothetical protein
MAGTSFTAQGQQDGWQYGVTVPLWASQISGDVTLRGVKQDVDVSFSDLKDHIDASFSLGFEARQEKFGFYGGFGYMEFSGGHNSAGGARAESELKFLIVDAGGFYRLVKTGEERPFILEAIAGLRYWHTESDLKITGTGGGVLLDDSNDNDLLDPIIGLRGTKYLTEKLHLDFQGDIGGFGLSDDTSDLTWSAAGLVSYDCARWLTLSAGYKALAIDVESGSGDRKRGLDLVFHGFLVAAKFTF